MYAWVNGNNTVKESHGIRPRKYTTTTTSEETFIYKGSRGLLQMYIIFNCELNRDNKITRRKEGQERAEFGARTDDHAKDLS